MRHLAILCVALVLGISPAVAQAQTAPLSPEARASVLQILRYDCGAAQEEARFGLAIAEIGQRAEPLLISVLRDGLPPEVAREQAEFAAQRYERRQRWLAESGREIFGEEAKTIGALPRDAYVQDSVRLLTVKFRENAARGLGIVGGPGSTAALKAAADDPDIRPIAIQALKRLEQRQ